MSRSPTAQYTWVGGGADGNWTTAANWAAGLVPVSSADAAVAFASSTNLAPNQNLANPFLPNSLSFAGAGEPHARWQRVGFRSQLCGDAAVAEPFRHTDDELCCYPRRDSHRDGHGDATFGRPIGGTGGLTFDIPYVYPSSGNFLLTAANTYSGPTVISGGMYTFDGTNASALNSSSFTVAGGSLSFSPSTLYANNPSQIGNVPVTLNGGSLVVHGATTFNSSITSESYGNLILGSGENGLLVSNNFPAPGCVLASTGTIVRSVGAVLDFNGDDLGRSGRITFATPPDLFGGGGAAGTPTVSIIPYAVAFVNTPPGEYQFATYGQNGVRPLASTEYATTLANGASTLVNLAVSSAITGIDSPTTVNAIKLVNGGSISGGGVLTVSSGVIMSDNLGTNAVTPTIAVSTLAFGNQEAIIRCINSLDIESSITGTGGLTVYGLYLNAPFSLPLTLGGQNSFSGDIRGHSRSTFAAMQALGPPRM